MTCKGCADERLKASWKNFEPKQEAGGREEAPPKSDSWADHSKEAANRWILEAPEIALPSEITKSYQAVQALHSVDLWWEHQPKPSTCKSSAAEKLQLLKVVLRRSVDQLSSILREGVLRFRRPMEIARLSARACRIISVRPEGSPTLMSRYTLTA
jgi:hypothetical protein